MRVYGVRFTPEARKLLAECRRWWRENRPAAPHAFDHELAEAVARLRQHPYSGAPHRHQDKADIRRLPLKRSRYNLYFRVYDDTGVIRIVSIWHMSRGKPPRL